MQVTPNVLEKFSAWADYSVCRKTQQKMILYHKSTYNTVGLMMCLLRITVLMELKLIIWITHRKKEITCQRKLEKGSNLYGLISALSGSCLSVIHHVNSLNRRKAI